MTQRAWAERFPQRCWAIESANGHSYLLAQQLVAAGEHVVDVPSTLSARVRVLDSTRSQKNDANDARSVAIVALRNPGLRVVAREDHVAVLRMQAKRHKQLASLKTQAAARLDAVLAQLSPGGLGKEMVPRQATGTALVVIGVSILATQRWQLRPLVVLGQMALTFYVFQAVVINWTPPRPETTTGEEYLLSAGLTVGFLAFAFIWVAFVTPRGPLELMLRARGPRSLPGPAEIPSPIRRE